MSAVVSGKRSPRLQPSRRLRVFFTARGVRAAIDMTLFARRMLMASAGAAILAVYTIAAIVASGSRSLPFIAIEIAIVAYLMLLRLRRHRNLQIKCPALPTQPIVRVVCVCIVIAFHLVVVALLGPFSSERWLPVFGLALLITGCYAASKNRRAVRWRIVGTGLTLQFWLCVFMLRVPAGMNAVGYAACGAQALLAHANAGAEFVFGSTVSSVWAFKVLPITVFFSSLCSVLLHLNVLQTLFNEVGGALSTLVGTSRAEAVCAVANVFLGQTEAPLLLRPIIGALTPSQLHCVMAGGFASVAGSTLGAYILMGVPATHLLAASVLSAPAALATAKLLHPDALPPPSRAAPRPLAGRDEGAEDGAAAHRRVATDGIVLVSMPPAVGGGLPREVMPAAGVIEDGLPDASAMPHAPVAGEDATPSSPSSPVFRTGRGGVEASDDAGDDAVGAAAPPDVLPSSMSGSVVQAAADGAVNAVPLTACIAATLIAFLALLSLLDSCVGYLGALVGIADLSFTRLLGWLFYPVALLMGVPPSECAFVGELLGIKMAANEFVAYARLGAAVDAGTVSRRALVISSYALCGFANLGSMGIMVGGLSILAPQKRNVLCAEVLRALIAGTLACFATACVAGAVYDVDAESAAGNAIANGTTSATSRVTC